jgi:hypothetical protein
MSAKRENRRGNYWLKRLRAFGVLRAELPQSQQFTLAISRLEALLDKAL